MIYLLNTPVLTAYGTYRFRGPLKVEKASELLVHGFVSAIGHVTTAELLSELLGFEIIHQRVQIEMKPGDQALVFRLLKRLPMGDISSRSALEKAGYELALLERIT